MVNPVLFLWCLLGLPHLVALETALLAGSEHRENTWKHLFALPIPRWTICAAKLLVGSGLVGLSTTSFVSARTEGLDLIGGEEPLHEIPEQPDQHLPVASREGQLPRRGGKPPSDGGWRCVTKKLELS
jgi:hypothetical protein